ncbi:MAG: tRNA pseudouridine(13) synthase TruD, partial [Candidatus Odinarchaeia archaeon]
VFEDFDSALKKAKSIVKEITQSKGIPNFYGYQRFGSKRCVNHIIGKLIIKREYKMAVKTFLCYEGEFENNKNRQIRAKIAKFLDDGVINFKIPHSMFYEKIVVKYLRRNPNDYLGALLKLPKSITKFFIHAYQSYLFNLFLSERYKSGFDFFTAYDGDIILVDEKEFLKFYRLKEDDVNDANEKIKHNNYKIIYPVIGFDSKLPSGSIGEMIKRIIKNEGIKISDFYFSDRPELSSEGSYRMLTTPILNLKLNSSKSEKVVNLDFNLVKGCYATVFIREILKGLDIVDL